MEIPRLGVELDTVYLDQEIADVTQEIQELTRRREALVEERVKRTLAQRAILDSMRGSE